MYALNPPAPRAHRSEDPHALGDHIARLAAELTVGEHALITAIGEFDDSGQWAKEGAYSCAQWLSWRIGMSPEASRERTRVAKTLRDLPAVDAAFGRGQLSYSKVRALTRVATAENEALLLDIAASSTAAQLERICRKFRGCMQASGAEAQDRRRLSVRYGDDGMMRFSVHLPADEGARLLAAIESGQAALRPDRSRAREPTAASLYSGSSTAPTASQPCTAPSAAPSSTTAPLPCTAPSSSAPGRAEAGPARFAPNPAPVSFAPSTPLSTTTGVSAESPSRVDGLMTVVESWFADGPKPRRGGAPNEILLHVAAETLATPLEPIDATNSARVDSAHAVPTHADPTRAVRPSTQTSDRPSDQTSDAFIDNAGGLGVPRDTALRLCCDASVTPIIKDAAGQVLDVGRKRRTVPAAIGRALEAEQGRICSFPGCTHTLFLDKHHIRHWAHGGQTRLDNLVQLCRHHHTFVHEYGWTLQKTPKGLTFTAPDGRTKSAVPQPPPLSQDALHLLAERAAEVDELTLRTEGWGDPVHYVHVVDVLVRAGADPVHPGGAGKPGSAGSAHR